MTAFRSRPRAVCVDLVRTLLKEQHFLPDVVRLKRARDAIDGFHLSHRGAEIWQAAHDARLPIAVITDLPKAKAVAAIQALPCDPDLLIASEDSDQYEGRPALLERAAEGLGMPANDVLYVGDADSTDNEAPSSFGMRTCAGDDAVAQLQLLDAGRRHTLLSDSCGDNSALAHTILLPLDLNVYDMGDVERFRRRCHFVCDAVLLIEGLVATSGFGLKAIQKILAGHVIILIGVASFDEEPDVKKIAVERLGRLREGGAERVIFVHTKNPAKVDQHKISMIAESLGYAIELQTWKTIMSA